MDVEKRASKAVSSRSRTRGADTERREVKRYGTDTQGRTWDAWCSGWEGEAMLVNMEEATSYCRPSPRLLLVGGRQRDDV